MTPETIIKNQVKSALGMVPNLFFFYVLQGIGAYKGIPDIIAIQEGKFYALEIKTEKGRLSEHQEQFKLDTEAAGGIYAVIRSPEDILKLFNVQYHL